MPPNDSFLDCWFLTGPTAAGKTGVGIELAEILGAEIISMDSMAVYRDMDIGTAKPTVEQRRAVAHHLTDVIEPHEAFSVAEYVEAVRRCVEKIETRGRKALFVGGTPLYLKGLLRGLFEGPAADWALRKRLQEEADEQGSEALHGRLAQVDPTTAGRLHPNDTRRLIRALEVFEKTGRPISELQKQFAVGREAAACRVFVLNWPRRELHARINRRVEIMFDEGLVDEVAGLLKTPEPLSRTARNAVGYREVIEHLAGRHTLDETIRLVQMHTRQLAKRQETWFRGLSECRFLPVHGEIDAGALARQIAEEGRRI